MQDLALQAAGALAIFVAVVHGAVGEVSVLPRAAIGLRRTANVVRMVWQASTVSWIGLGLLLIATPGFAEPARTWICLIAVAVYGYAAVGNAVVTRFRHVGWVLMTVVVALAIAGL